MSIARSALDAPERERDRDRERETCFNASDDVLLPMHEILR